MTFVPSETTAKSRYSTIQRLAIQGGFVLFAFCLMQMWEDKKMLAMYREGTQLGAKSLSFGPKKVSTFRHRKGLCSFLPPRQTATSLWNENLEMILNVSLYPSTTNNTDALKWMEPFSRLVATRWLRKGYRAAPLPHAWGKVLDIVYARMMDPNAKPLKVAIFGGSVTNGGRAHETGINLQKMGFHESPQEWIEHVSKCRWSLWLDFLLNTVLGGDANAGIVKVYNLAVSATGTELAIPMIIYNLYIKELLPDGPDIIINSHSTNDQNVAGRHVANVTRSLTYSETLRQLAEKFIRACIDSQPCSDLPLIIYLDDYIGNFHDIIRGETVNNKVIQELSDWYGTMFVSYADAFRRFVYADDTEEIFTAPWPWNAQDRNEVEVHFGVSSHLAVAWVMAFAMLSATVDYCDDMDANFAPSDLIPANVTNLMERVPPPAFNSDLLLSNVSTKWRTEALLRDKARTRYCSDESARQANPCVLAFVAGPMGTVRNTDQLNEYLGHFVISNIGWDAINDAGKDKDKVGYVASDMNASVTLKIPKIQNEAKVISVYYLKSYGEKWADSTARFELSAWGTKHTGVISTFELEGFHNSTSSISYEHVLDLGDDSVQIGDDFQLKIDLVGGTTFKITAMMICNR